MYNSMCIASILVEISKAKVGHFVSKTVIIKWRVPLAASPRPGQLQVSEIGYQLSERISQKDSKRNSELRGTKLLRAKPPKQSTPRTSIRKN